MLDTRAPLVNVRPHHFEQPDGAGTAALLGPHQRGKPPVRRSHQHRGHPRSRPGHLGDVADGAPFEGDDSVRINNRCGRRVQHLVYHVQLLMPVVEDGPDDVEVLRELGLDQRFDVLAAPADVRTVHEQDDVDAAPVRRLPVTVGQQSGHRLDHGRHCAATQHQAPQSARVQPRMTEATWPSSVSGQRLRCRRDGVRQVLPGARRSAQPSLLTTSFTSGQTLATDT